MTLIADGLCARGQVTVAHEPSNKAENTSHQWAKLDNGKVGSVNESQTYFKDESIASKEQLACHSETTDQTTQQKPTFQNSTFKNITPENYMSQLSTETLEEDNKKERNMSDDGQQLTCMYKKE